MQNSPHLLEKAAARFSSPSSAGYSEASRSGVLSLSKCWVGRVLFDADALPSQEDSHGPRLPHMVVLSRVVEGHKMFRGE